MIALLRFLDLREVRLQLLVRGERRPVDALHRRVARISLPVGVRRAQELERLELVRARHVRADAEVDERLLVLDRVAGDFLLTFRLLVDQLHLQRLAAVSEERLCLVARPHLALIGQILLRELAHLVLDAVEILGHERPIDDEVVEEAFVSRRPDAALRAGKEIRDRGRHQMRRAVTQQRQRLGALVCDDADGGILLERIGQVHELAVDDRGVRRLREAGRDPCRNVAHGRAGGHIASGSVGKRNRDLTHALSGKVEVGRRGWTRTTDLLRVREAL